MTKPTLAPRQIIYLTCQQARLYGEVIQVLAERQRCWIRPLWLVMPNQVLTIQPTLGQPDHNSPDSDIRMPDLIWPLAQVYPALDTDVVTLLATAPGESSTQAPDPVVSLRQFIDCLWQARAEGSGPASIPSSP